RDPFRTDNLPAVPETAIEHELTDLGKIARAQAQSAMAADVAAGESSPLRVGDRKRIEQRLARDDVERPPRGFLDPALPQRRPATAIVVKSARRRRHLPLQDLA